MELKEFAAFAITEAEKLFEAKQYAQAVAKLEILSLTIESQIETIEKIARKANASGK